MRKTLGLAILPAFALLAACSEGAEDNDIGIDTIPDSSMNSSDSLGMDPSTMNQSGTQMGTAGTSSTSGANSSGMGGSDAPGSVSDGPMPGPDSGEANEGGTNPNDTDVGLDDSVDAEESY